MFLQIDKKFSILTIIYAAITGSIFILTSCNNDTTTNPPTTTTNPDVSTYDSIYVEETIDSTSYCGMDLLLGKTVLRDNHAKDVQLVDSASTGVNFYLRSGDLSDKLNIQIGEQTRFYRFYANMTSAQFDTITKLPVGRDTILPQLDFTSDDSYGKGAWGYFNVPLATYPVFGIWLEGKHNDGTTPFNVYAIVQPRTMIDRNPGVPGGVQMSFRVRINKAGKNDFRQMIPANK